MGTNGLLSFGDSYNSFFNQPFTQNDTRYLVAPFWDDVDIRGSNGDIFYMTTESGLFLYQVNSYIQYARPTNFEATWMLVAYWVGVHPYFGASNPDVSIIIHFTKSTRLDTFPHLGKYIPSYYCF